MFPKKSYHIKNENRRDNRINKIQKMKILIHKIKIKTNCNYEIHKA